MALSVAWGIEVRIPAQCFPRFSCASHALRAFSRRILFGAMARIHSYSSRAPISWDGSEELKHSDGCGRTLRPTTKFVAMSSRKSFRACRDSPHVVNNYRNTEDGRSARPSRVLIQPRPRCNPGGLESSIKEQCDNIQPSRCPHRYSGSGLQRIPRLLGPP